MSSRKSSQGSGGQQSSASSGASREANKQKKNSGSKSFGGTDKPKTWDEGDDAPQHTKSSLVATSTLTINPKVYRISYVLIYKVWRTYSSSPFLLFTRNLFIIIVLLMT